jgi:M penetrans paralogue family 26
MEQSNFTELEANQKLPNATAVMVLGIVSIVTCCCYGILGIITGGVGLYLAKKDQALYNTSPDSFTNYSNLKTGKILCYIGLGLSVLYLIYMIVLIGSIGLDALSNPELMQQRIQELMGA